jgi:hypothetical protein
MIEEVGGKCAWPHKSIPIFIRADLGGGFQNSQELHVKKYKEAMQGPDNDKWKESVFEEHDRIVKNQVWRAVDRKDVPKHANVMT